MPARILVVDDDERTRDVITGVLTEAGHTVDAPVDAYVGLDFARTRDYDLILVEDEMPLIDGAGVIRTLRESSISTCVLGLSSRTPEESSVLTDAGAAAVLHKPFRVDDLRDTVARLLTG